MKHLRRFLLAAGLVTLAAGLGGLLFLYVRRPVLKLQGSNSALLTRYYHSIRAREINEQGIVMTVDGAVPGQEEPGQLFMTDEMELRMPAGWLNDYFNCDVYVSADEVRVGKGGRAAILDIDEDGRVSVSAAAQALGYSFSWDEENGASELKAPEELSVQYPVRYDLRAEGRVSPVRDQAQWATCWAFAALSAVESALLPEKELQLSVDHLSYHHGFSAEANEGGDYNMALAYFASWRGPVAEELDPYGDGESPEALPAAVHVQDAVILSEPDIPRLKALIAESGAVECAIYAQQDILSMSSFYDPETASYYYSGDEICNHDIDIIGWDDFYPRENFPEEPPGDGAFLCKNSWGEEFGNGGYFYISYYDVNIGRFGVAYTGVEGTDNYDHIYQSDLLGWSGAIGYGSPSAIFAAVYTADSPQTLSAAAFYATDAGTWYDIYLVHEFEDVTDFSAARHIRSGYLPDRGFFTIDLGDEEDLAGGERFAVAVRIRTEGATHPVAMEYAGSAISGSARIDDGETYMSPNGRSWTSVEEAAQGNVCLKVYTGDR